MFTGSRTPVSPSRRRQMMLGRLERVFARIVDGGVASAFRLRVQPAEIGRQLERAMLDGRVTSVGASLAPNRYQVRLHPDDAAAFAGWEEALCREMETWLAELVFARGYATVGSIQVRLFGDAAVPRRAVRAEARFSDAAAPSPRRTPQERGARLHLRPDDDALPAMHLVSGAVTVGRADDNDLVLRDPEVSRHHARIEPGGVGWQVVDLDSTNGTTVNGVSIDRAAIAAGDSVAFGGVRFAVTSE